LLRQIKFRLHRHVNQPAVVTWRTPRRRRSMVAFLAGLTTALRSWPAWQSGRLPPPRAPVVPCRGRRRGHSAHVYRRLPDGTWSFEALRGLGAIRQPRSAAVRDLRVRRDRRTGSQRGDRPGAL